jgi:membrane protein implicated in regulation of membrane protease activity
MYNWYWQYHLVRSKETCTIDADNFTWWDQRKHVQLILINCTCFLWSHQVILSVSIVDVSFHLTKWYCQYQLYMFPLISPSDIVSINFTWWDQRKHVQLILTISLGEIKGNMYNWYWQYQLVRSKETCTIDSDNITSDIVSINCTCFRWSHQMILSVSIVHVYFDLTKWNFQYQLYMFPLISPSDKETGIIDTDNITW